MILKKSRRGVEAREIPMDHESKEKGSFILKKFEYVDPKGISKSVDHAVVDSGCSSHMTGNKAYLSDYVDYNGGFVAFRSDPKEVNVDACTQEHYVAGSSEKDKEPTQEYILLPLHPHRPRISVEDVVQAAQEKPSENSPKDNDVQDSEDVAEKEEQHTLTEAEQTLKDDLERMIAQEIAAKAIYDVIRQAFEEEKKRASSCYHTANTSYASAASTPTGANTGGSSFVYLGGQIPIDASTLPNADLPIDPNMPDLEDDSNADFNNMNNTIDVSPIPTLRVHKDHPKGQILGDPKLAVQTRGKIQKASSVQQALNVYPSLIGWKAGLKAMQEELLQYKLQKVNLVLPGIQVGAARQKFMLLVTVTTIGDHTRLSLKFVDQHNMVACLEKTGGNSEFHEIVDFHTSSLIHHAITVSPTICTYYIEKFWNTASSQTVNDVKQIDATVDSKAVVVTEASIRSSLLFNDDDGTACLTNEAICQNLALMGYEGDFNILTFQKALFSPQWMFLIHTILHCLSLKSTSWNEFSTNLLPLLYLCH
ncbi:hypothetical protein Tco_0235953 [Tanacetum coccineum]